MIDGDEEAFEQFADLYIPVIYRFASYRLRGERELVNEIVQATLAKVIAKLATFRGDAALSTWLCAVCRNEIAGHFRKERRAGVEVDFQGVEEAAPEVLGDRRPESPETGLLRDETARLVHLALDSLPAHYGQALQWKYLENLSVREIASRLRLGLKAAESLLTRAREAFRREYATRTAPMAASVQPAPFPKVRMGMKP